jgi:hypothetical protein
VLANRRRLDFPRIGAAFLSAAATRLHSDPFERMLNTAKDLLSSPPAFHSFAPDEPKKVSNRTIGVPMTFSQKSDVKRHLAHGLKKTHYLTPTNLNTPADKVDQESAAATDSTVTRLDDRETILPAKLP